MLTKVTLQSNEQLTLCPFNVTTLKVFDLRLCPLYGMLLKDCLVCACGFAQHRVVDNVKAVLIPGQRGQSVRELYRFLHCLLMMVFK